MQICNKPGSAAGGPCSSPDCAAFSRFVLHEGVEFRAFSAGEILSQPRVTPYDAFAIWLHCRRERFRG